MGIYGCLQSAILVFNKNTIKNEEDKKKKKTSVFVPPSRYCTVLVSLFSVTSWGWVLYKEKIYLAYSFGGLRAQHCHLLGSVGGFMVDSLKARVSERRNHLVRQKSRGGSGQDCSSWELTKISQELPKNSWEQCPCWPTRFNL